MRKINYRVLTPSEYESVDKTHIIDSEGVEYRFIHYTSYTKSSNHFLLVDDDSLVVEDFYEDLSDFMVELINDPKTEQRMSGFGQDDRYLFKSITSSGIEYIVEFYGGSNIVLIIDPSKKVSENIVLSSRLSTITTESVEEALVRGKPDKRAYKHPDYYEGCYTDISSKFDTSVEGSIHDFYQKLFKLNANLSRLLSHIHNEDDNFLELSKGKKLLFTGITSRHEYYILDDTFTNLKSYIKRGLRDLSELSTTELRNLHINFTDFIKYLYDLYDSYTDYEDIFTNYRVKNSYEELLDLVEDVKDLRDEISEYY